MGLSRQCFSAFSKLRIQIVSPPLHHRCALLEILRVVLCGSPFVALHVGELQFNMGLLESVLTQNRRRQPTEPMSGHAISIAKPVERIEDRVVAHGLFLIVGSWENKVSIASKQF